MIRGGAKLPARRRRRRVRGGRRLRGLGQELREARPVGGEQSNTSIVFDEELILKVFRRLEAGINPELELLRFLTEHGFENIAAARRLVRVRRPPDGRDARHPAALRRDGAGRLGARARHDGRASPSASSTSLHRLGEVTGAMHTLLGCDSHDPSFCPEETVVRVARPADRDGRRGDRVDLPRPARRRRRARADPRPRRGGARAAAPADEPRRHRPRDPPSRRLPSRPDALGRRRLGDPRLRGRARALAAGAAPQAKPAARRRRHAALVRVRRVRRRRCCAASSRPPAGRSARAPSSSTATARRSTSTWFRPARRWTSS